VPTYRYVTGLAFAFALTASALMPRPSSAYFAGPPNGRCGDPPADATCKRSMCHISYPLNSGDGTLTIQGLPARYAPDLTADNGLRLDICPNPAPANAVLRLSVPAATSASLTLVDPAGRHVRSFPFDHLAAGVTNVYLNGLDDSGRRVAPGAYYYVLVAGTDRRSGRFVVTR
jgi:hypothetical protein